MLAGKKFRSDDIGETEAAYSEAKDILLYRNGDEMFLAALELIVLLPAEMIVDE